MAWANQTVTVTQDAENVYLQVGPEGFTFDRDRLRAPVAGNAASTKTIRC